MTKSERSGLLDVCASTSLLLEEISPGMIPWAMREGKEKAFMEALKSLREKASKFPKDWVSMTAGQLAMGYTLRSPREVERFLSEEGPRLSEESRDFLRRLMARPAYFSAFAPGEALGDDLFEIVDFGSGATDVMCSPSLADLYRSRPSSCLTLLFHNGRCLQTIGPLHYYRGFEGIDFHYYARIYRPQEYAVGGLSVVMTAQPERFVILDFFSEIPPIAHEGTRLYSFSSNVNAAAFDPSALGPGFDVTEAKGIVRCRLQGSAPVFSEASLYWERKKGRLHLYTKSRLDYTRVALAAAGQAEIPPEPDWQCTQNMEVAATMLLGRNPPVFGLERPFQEPLPDKESRVMLEQVNRFMRELTDAQNDGRPYSLEEVAARHGVSMDTAHQVEEMLARQNRDMEIDVEGGLAGLPVFPPSEREKLREPLARCPVFRFAGNEEAMRLFREATPFIEALRRPERISRTRKILTLGTFADVLEEIDDLHWQDPQNTVLKHTFFLLCCKGAEWQSTADYAAEILRLFWQVVLTSKERAQARRFVRQYSIWSQARRGTRGPAHPSE